MNTRSISVFFPQIDLALKQPLITQSRLAMMYLFLISYSNRLYFQFILSSSLTSSALLTAGQQLDASISKLFLTCGYQLSDSEIRTAWVNLKKFSDIDELKTTIKSYLQKVSNMRRNVELDIVIKQLT